MARRTTNNGRKLGIDAATPRNRRKPRVNVACGLTPADIAKITAIAPDAEVTLAGTRQKGKYRAVLAEYTDPSRIKPKGTK